MPEQFNPGAKEHVVTLQGRKFITFVGLQARLADQGKHIHGLEIEIIRDPFDEDNKENKQALVRATVHVVAENGAVSKVQSLGDASKLNVSKNIEDATLRMAETRAIARALRIITRAPFTAVEEIPPSD